MWFRKRKTIEEMLETIRPFGIELCGGATIADLTDQYGRKEIEAAGFELFLCALGSEAMERSEDEQEDHFRALSNDIWHLDYECIDDPSDYRKVLERLALLSRGDLALRNPDKDLDDASFESGRAFVALGIASEPLNLTWQNDWLDPAVIYACNNRLIELGSPKRFVAHSTGQASLIICQPPGRIDALNKATGLTFVQQYD